MRKWLHTLQILLALALGTAVPSVAQNQPPPSQRFDVVETTISETQMALEGGQITSRDLVLLYLARIAYHEDRLNGVLTLSRNALAEADRLDRERAEGRVRGLLHGIPIALKDNIHTTDMPTTGGALAFQHLTPPYEATLTRNLREGGAIIIAKTVMTELANWVAGDPTGMPGNYSALGRFSFNPYDPRPDPRPGFDDGRPVLDTGGSSSGIGTAASFWMANVGTETSGSILNPSSQNMLVGIKPTVGRISRHGVIPITGDQDTPGPMARTVRDAAIVLGVLEGSEPDVNDPATTTCTPPPGGDYTAFLSKDGLRGARIGIPRTFFYNAVVPAGGTTSRGGLTPARLASMEQAIESLNKAGAIIVDPAEIPSIVDLDPTKNFLNWGLCSGLDDRKGRDFGCSVVLKYGMKRDFNAWLDSLGEQAPLKTLTELRYFNLAHPQLQAIRYGQFRLDIADEMDVVADEIRYRADRGKDLHLAATHGIDEVMREHELDALLFPGSRGANIAARPGYPSITVPFGLVPNAPTPPLPDEFRALPEPLGVTFMGPACSEPRLVELAYAFEQATLSRRPPALTP